MTQCRVLFVCFPTPQTAALQPTALTMTLDHPSMHSDSQQQIIHRDYTLHFTDILSLHIKGHFSTWTRVS